jgi:hypothetical protein
MSALQISRMIGLPYKTTWFLCHRIRESLRETPAGQLGDRTKLLKQMKATLAARPGTARIASPRRRKQYSHSSNVMETFAPSTL